MSLRGFWQFSSVDDFIVLPPLHGLFSRDMAMHPRLSSWAGSKSSVCLPLPQACSSNHRSPHTCVEGPSPCVQRVHICPQRFNAGAKSPGSDRPRFRGSGFPAPTLHTSVPGFGSLPPHGCRDSRRITPSRNSRTFPLYLPVFPLLAQARRSLHGQQ